MANFSKLKLALITGVAFISTQSFAQEEIGELIKSSPADATLLTKAYMEPFFKGVGLGLNSGWTNTGSVKKLGRFEIRVGATGAFVPTKARSFDVSKIGLSNNIYYNNQPVNQQNGVMAPTFSGEGSLPLTVQKDGQSLSSFNLSGIDAPIMPAPQLQASIGLVKGFEATVRYVPEIKPGKDYGTLSMIGGGIKFQPLRFLSKTGNKLLPVDLAMAIGWSQFKYSYDLDVKPETGAQPKNNQQSQDFSNQKVEAKFSGINVEAIASKKLLMFTPFVSVGYQTSNTNGGLKGNYPVSTGFGPAGLYRTYETFADPVSIDKKYVNNLRASAGFQLNLFILHLYGSYNVAAYNYVNVGVGLGFGK